MDPKDPSNGPNPCGAGCNPPGMPACKVMQPQPVVSVAFSNHGDVDVESANPTAFVQTHIVVNYLP